MLPKQALSKQRKNAKALFIACVTSSKKLEVSCTGDTWAVWRIDLRWLIFFSHHKILKSKVHLLFVVNWMTALVEIEEKPQTAPKLFERSRGY